MDEAIPTRGKPLHPALLMLAYLVGAAAAVLPLAFARVPPLVDYPNHLARQWILLHGTEIPALAANYHADWRILPDLAMDGVVVALAQAMLLEWAGRCFIALTLLALLAGTAALHRALFGRVGLWPLAALLVLYNTMLFWGFLSCLFSLGLALLAFAGWHAARGWSLAARVAVFTPVATLLMLGHLFAFGLYGLLVAGQLLRARMDWRVLPVGVQFLPGVALWIASLDVALTTHTAYGDSADKLVGLLAPFTFRNGPAPLDLVTWLFAVLVLVRGLSRGGLVLAPAMRRPLAVVAVAAVAMPTWIGGGWGADMRLPTVLPLLLIAATEPRRLPTGPVLIAAVLFGLRIWTVGQGFADADRWFGEFRAAAAVLPPGARLMVVEPEPSDPPPPLPHLPPLLDAGSLRIFDHLPALAVIDRAAMFPYLFTMWNPLRTDPRVADITQVHGQPATPAYLAMPPEQAERRVSEIGERPYWRHWPAAFDYLFWLSLHPDSEHIPPTLTEVARGSLFRLYRIQH